MKRVLMITGCWPPTTRVGARRVVRLARRLPALGWTPVVLTIDESEAYAAPRGTDHSLVAPAVEVHRVSATYPSIRLERRLLSLMGRWPKAAKIATVLLRDWRPPDQFVEWTLAAVRKAKSLGHFDAVWVTGAPFGMFVPGAVVARALGKPVVFDYRDPWTPDLPERTHPLGIPNRARVALERLLLRQADAVVYVNQDMYDRYEATFGREHGGRRRDVPWAVIPNGFDPEDAPTGAPITDPRPVLLYAGVCYGSRSMLPILEALAEGFGPGDDGLLLRIFGTLDPAAEAYLKANPLPGRVEVNGRIPSDEVVRHMRGAEALLLLIGDTHRTALSAKVFDYLLAARPMLGTGPQGSTAGELINTCGVGQWIDGGVEGRPALIAALRQVEARALAFEPIADEIRRYSADGMASATVRMLIAVDRRE
ncbi:MAG: hypothetical protein ACI9U2_001520 [Bradymonadia bacterium]|jgi:hypothetical protein